jgi:hypothetical protein
MYQQYAVRMRSHHGIALQSIHMTGRTVALEELWNDAVALGLGEATVGMNMAAPRTMRKAADAGELIRTVDRFFIHPRFRREFG